MSEASKPIPILLLKTKSTPADGYEEYFQSGPNGPFTPTFVPVLEHHFRENALEKIYNLLIEDSLVSRRHPSPNETYGGIIFTSQRAVEAFSSVISRLRKEGKPFGDPEKSESIPFYVVGPATARGLKTLNMNYHPIRGEETGNGEALAHCILDHYNRLWSSLLETKPPLLFLVGEQRRDIIPKTLQSDSVDVLDRIRVEELVVYETGEMQSFKEVFTWQWSHNVESGHVVQWVVVFSPTGCKAMLDSLGWLDQKTGKAVRTHELRSSKKSTTYIATIGPTTRDYLRKEFDFEPDVCAETPSPEGVGKAIAEFMDKLDANKI